MGANFAQCGANIFSNARKDEELMRLPLQDTMLARHLSTVEGRSSRSPLTGRASCRKAITSLLVAKRNENFCRDLEVCSRKRHSRYQRNERMVSPNGLLQKVCGYLTNPRNMQCKAGSFFG
jgi:hypothetical protein